MIDYVSVALSPIAGIFSLFLFILLIILMVKSPKVGVWLVSMVILIPLAAIVFKGMPNVGPPISPAIGIGGCFVFVLLIVMLHKAPKAAIALIVAIVSVVLLSVLGMLPMMRDARRAYRSRQQATAIIQQTEPSYVPPHPEVVYDGFRQPSRGSYAVVGDGSRSVASHANISEPAVTAPIWSEGVEDQYEADVCPSKQAAVTALGPKLKDWVQQVIAEANEPVKVILFQEDNNRSIMWRFEQSLEQALPGVACSIESGSRNIDWNEISVTLRFEVTMSQTPSWQDHGPALQPTSRSATVTVPQTAAMLDTGQAVAKARCRERAITVTQSFSEKPWADDFSSFVNELPGRHFLVARSRGACTSENEAKRQAEADACEQLGVRLAETFPRSFPNQAIPALTPAKLREGGFVVDQFLQSFDGISGRLWREAMLIDAGDQKMAGLEHETRIGMQVERMTWARMILSSIGALVVIVVSYLFLSMATRGYYVWSLRIAGLVLAIAGIVSIFLVLK